MEELREAVAFSPAHITGFFQICDEPGDPLLKGSRGAGVSLERGVTTAVRVERSRSPFVRILINGRVDASAVVSHCVANAFLRLAGEGYSITAEHSVDVPTGCGFGSSGAGALSLALALNEALGLGLPRVKVAQIAHVAEIECKTGLGTVIAECVGGFEVRVKPGAPGIGEVKSVLVGDEYRVVSLSFGPVSTKKALANETFRRRISELGGEFTDRLASHPTIPEFLSLSRSFSEHVGLITKNARRILRETDAAGLLFSTTVFGDAVFSVVEEDRVGDALEVLGRYACSGGRVILSRIDSRGARVL